MRKRLSLSTHCRIEIDFIMDDIATFTMRIVFVHNC